MVKTTLSIVNIIHFNPYTKFSLKDQQEKTQRDLGQVNFRPSMLLILTVLCKKQIAHF